jgi:flavin reductase (DIM6/NTAB) family NADH-FMN oxidoreductase RutF
MQVASNPTRLAISVQKHTLTGETIAKTGVFNLSVLTEDVPFEVIQRFGMQTGREADKFAGFDAVKRSSNGLLYQTAHTNAMFSCKVLQAIDLEDHMMFLAEVTESKVLGSGPSCTYDHYHKAIKEKF